MTWPQVLTMIAAIVVPVTGMVGFAVYRFANVEAAVKHQAKCNRVMVRQFARLRVTVKRIEKQVGS